MNNNEQGPGDLGVFAEELLVLIDAGLEIKIRHAQGRYVPGHFMFVSLSVPGEAEGYELVEVGE